MRHHLTKGWEYRWGLMVVCLGVWEAAALSFRPNGQKRVPTITHTVRTAHRHRNVVTKLLVGMWLLALGKHLLAEVVEEALV